MSLGIEIKAVAEGASRLNAVKSGLNGIAATAAATALVSLSLGFLAEPKPDQTAVDIAQLKAENDRLRAQFDRLLKTQERVINLLEKSPDDGAVARLTAMTSNLAARQARIEQAIADSPEKSLSIPMLRRDIEAMKDTHSRTESALKGSIDQIYDLTKWLLGALAVGVLSMAVTNLLQRKRED